MAIKKKSVFDIINETNQNCDRIKALAKTARGRIPEADEFLDAAAHNLNLACVNLNEYLRSLLY